jgi:hypothetical protein
MVRCLVAGSWSGPPGRACHQQLLQDDHLQQQQQIGRVQQCRHRCSTRNSNVKSAVLWVAVRMATAAAAAAVALHVKYAILLKLTLHAQGCRKMHKYLTNQQQAVALVHNAPFTLLRSRGSPLSTRLVPSLPRKRNSPHACTTQCRRPSPLCCVTHLYVVSHASMLCHTPLCCVTHLYVVSHTSMLCHTPLCCVTHLYVVSHASMLCHIPLSTELLVSLPRKR